MTLAPSGNVASADVIIFLKASPVDSIFAENVLVGLPFS